MGLCGLTRPSSPSQRSRNRQAKVGRGAIRYRPSGSQKDVLQVLDSTYLLELPHAISLLAPVALDIPLFLVQPGGKERASRGMPEGPTASQSQVSGSPIALIVVGLITPIGTVARIRSHTDTRPR